MISLNIKADVYYYPLKTRDGVKVMMRVEVPLQSKIAVLFSAEDMEQGQEISDMLNNESSEYLWE